MKKYLFAPLAAVCLNWTGAAIAADFVAVRIEAENFTSKSDRWVLTSPDSVPDAQPDPDPPHNDSASGSANLELLPDTRVTHNDEIFGGADGNFWGGPSGGPRIDYNVDIPEPGRYFVYVKTYSTNTEDNGIHVGVNGTTPESGKRVQICSKHNWFWTSGQRTDENHCGVTKTIWLDFPAAGVNTVTFFAREDGFEIDQFLLLKETHDGSLNCFPTFNDKLRCNDAVTNARVSETDVPVSQTVDGNLLTSPPEPDPSTAQVDLDIDIDTNGSVHFTGDIIAYQIEVSNINTSDTATNSLVKIDLPASLEFSSSSDCTLAGSSLNCDVGDLPAGSLHTLAFTATAITEGSHRVDAQVTAEENDANNSNNTESATVTTQQSVPDFEAGISLAQRSNATALGDVNQYTVTIENNGLQAIDSAAISVTTDDGLAVQDCNPSCAIPTVASGESTTITFQTTAIEPGVHNVTANLQLADDADSVNNTATLNELVVEPIVALGTDNAIVIEAESFSRSSAAATDNAPQWFVIDNNFRPLDEQLDPDNASPVSVSGSAYIEALPDLRIDNNAATVPGASNFPTGGIGATVTYQTYFSKAGTYHIYARVRSNNNQDSSLHVGLNNLWPQTAESVSVCNSNGDWQWTNSLTNNGSCGTSGGATIQIESPGVHTLMISQDTDGLELDKLILSKDALPDLNGIGPLASTVDPTQQTNIGISAELLNDQSNPDQAILTIVLNNESSTNASGVTVSINGITSQSYAADGFDNCSNTGSSLVCTLAELDAGQQATGTVQFDTDDSDNLEVRSAVDSIQFDVNEQNNTTTAGLNLSQSPNRSNMQASSSGGGSMSVWLMLFALLLLGFRTSFYFNYSAAVANTHNIDA